MASAAGESGADGGDRCPSGEKGTTPVGRQSKKPSTFHRAALRYLEKKNVENVWQGARNLRLILRICCGGTVRHHQTRRFQLRHLLLRQQEIRQSILRSHARTVENLCVVRIFKLHVCFWEVCVSFLMQSMYVLLTKSCQMVEDLCVV